MKQSDTTSNKELTLIVSSLQQGFNAVSGAVDTLTSQVQQLQTTTQFTTTPQAVNQIYNGSFTHSQRSWINSSTADDGRYECYNWFSHPNNPNQPMYANTTVSSDAITVFTQADVTAPSTITITNHGLGQGLRVYFSAVTPVPPLVSGTKYFVIYVDANNIKLAATAADADAGTAIVLTAGAGVAPNVLTFNYALKTPDHALYSETFTDWSWIAPSAGCARFQGATTLDTIIPGNNIEPGYTYYGMFNIVKLNPYVTAAVEERIFCGLYAKKTGAEWDWIHGDFTVTATVLGAASGSAANYRILAKTDRGFSVRSSVVNISTGPTDVEFAAGSRVFLQWKNVLVYGVQSYEIWRERPAGSGTYVLLQIITTGLTQTLDNNAATATTSGSWPSADFDSLVAYTATIPNIIDALPYSGDPLNPSWASIPFTLKVPQNFNMSAIDLTAKQWLRWGFSSVTQNLDLKLTNCSVSNSGIFGGTVFNIADQFTDGTGGTVDMTGLTVLLTSKGETDITSTITVVNNTGELTLNDPIPYDSDVATLTIYHGAPDHSVFCDLAHLTYIQGAAFSPAAADIDTTHGTPPIQPNGTTQGGSGVGQQGGGIDGQPVCLYEEEEVETENGVVLARELKIGDKLKDGYGLLNTVAKMQMGICDVWLLETENGVTLKATPTKQVFTPEGKKTLASLEKGDKIYTAVNDVLQESRILIKSLLLKDQVVVQIGLTPTESFLAGGGTGKVLVSNRKQILIGGGGDIFSGTLI